MNQNDGMAKSERSELLRLVKARARVAKAELLAEFEQKLAAKYLPSDHPAWEELTATATKAVADADAQIAEVCRELGIPEKWRPGISASWYGRGENASAMRRAELRKVASTRLDAEGKKAKHAIEAKAVEMQSVLVAGALESSDAKAFLETMPTPESLMVPLQLPDVENASLQAEPKYIRYGDPLE